VNISDYEESFQVRTYESDHRGLVRPVAILNYLQEVAGAHAEQLGFSVNNLLARGITWVMSRSHVRFLRDPGVGEKLRVRTWPSGRRGLHAMREFEVFDDSSQMVAVGTSSWVIVDIESKRPVRIEKVIPTYPPTARRALDDGFAALPVLTGADHELPFRVRLGDLDINQHVNNVVYAGWALEALPEQWQQCHRPAAIEIAYRSEAFSGDRVVSRAQAFTAGDASGFLHQLVSEADGRELTRLRTLWR
jgi:medium-chain acyl-[acyl-carrier-protein] hydrolase